MGTPDYAFVKQYQDSITMLAQQMTPLLRPAVMVDTNFKGEAKFYEQYASDQLVELTTRYQDTPVQLPDHRRRKVTPRYFVGNTLEDPADALQMLIDPKSTYMQAKQAAAGRKFDDLVIAAIGGTAYIGKEGTTTQAFSTTNLVPVAASGMTKNKILRAKRFLDAGQVEKEDRFMLHGSAQMEDLLKTTEPASIDFNVVRPLVEGTITKWVGFEWIGTERLLSDGGTPATRYCYAFQKKGLQAAIQKEPEGRVTERPDKNYAWQVYLRMCMGATRLEEERCVKISCLETA